MHKWYLMIIMILSGYLVGRLQMAVLGSKCGWWPDPRLAGSGNPGATNVVRLSGWWQGLVVFAVDFGKSYLMVRLVSLLCELPFFTPCRWHMLLQMLAGFMVFIGHVYPLGRLGGKGIACLFGWSFAVNLEWGILSWLIWSAVVFLTQVSSLGGIAMMLMGVAWVLVHLPLNCALLWIFAVVISFWRHRDNWQRLSI